MIVPSALMLVSHAIHGSPSESGRSIRTTTSLASTRSRRMRASAKSAGVICRAIVGFVAFVGGVADETEHA